MTRHRMRRGQGTVYEDPPASGRYRGQITGPDGRRHSVRGTLDRVEAELDRLRATIRDGLPVPDPRLTLAEYLTGSRTGVPLERIQELGGWLGDVVRPGVAPRTFKRYEEIVRVHLVPALGGHPLGKLTPQTIQRYYRQAVESGLSAGTVKHLHEVLRNALGHAVRVGLTARNVAELARPPRVVRPEPRVLTAEEARRLLELVQDGPIECLITLAITTGLRHGELLGLRWSQIDLEAGVLRVPDQVQRIPRGGIQRVPVKSRAGRRPVLLTLIGLEALRRQALLIERMALAAGARWEDHDLVHPNAVGRPLEQGRVLARFGPVREALGLPRLRIHDLRHSVATLLFSAGVPAKVVQEILGHSGVGITTDLYTHHVPELQRDAMAELQRLLRPAGESTGPRRLRLVQWSGAESGGP